MKSVSLIGMPGAGKSTIGVLLAKKLGYAFVDTDISIQVAAGKTLSALIQENGEEKLMQLESEVISEIQPRRQVIATGGSAVFGDKGMANLCKNSTIIYLRVSLETLEERLGDPVQRGVVLSGCKNVSELYQYRIPKYEEYAEITVDCDELSVEECAEEIIKALEEVK